LQPIRPAALNRSPEDRPALDQAGEGRNVRRCSATQPALIVSLYQTQGWGNYGPKARKDPLTRVTIKPGATFGQLDAYLRDLLNVDGHLSLFRVKTGKETYGRPEEVEVAGDYGDFDADGMRGSSSKVKSLVWDGKASEAVWHFDMGSTTHIIIRVNELASAAETGALTSPVQDYAPDAEVEDEQEEDDPQGPTFDDAYPTLLGQIESFEGIIGIGMGAGSNHYFAFVCNEGGNVSDMHQPHVDGIGGDVISSSLRKMEMEAMQMYGGMISHQTFTFDFASKYPKVAQFISVKGTRKRWIEFGTGRGGPFIKALKGCKEEVVWQSPVRQQYNLSPHTALCALEKNL